MLTILTTPLLTFGAPPPLQDNPKKHPQVRRYQTNFQEEKREKRQEEEGAGIAQALPFQETLLLDNQYRPDQYQYRSTYRLVGEGGLVKVQRKKVAKKKKKTAESNIRVTTTDDDVLPTQVLLGRVKAVKVTEKLRKTESHGEQEEIIWAELKSADRSQKRGASEPNLWAELTDQTEASPRGLHELQMVNHNLRPRVYFLPS